MTSLPVNQQVRFTVRTGDLAIRDVVAIGVGHMKPNELVLVIREPGVEGERVFSVLFTRGFRVTKQRVKHA